MFSRYRLRRKCSIGDVMDVREEFYNRIKEQAAQTEDLVRKLAEFRDTDSGKFRFFIELVSPELAELKHANPRQMSGA